MLLKATITPRRRRLQRPLRRMQVHEKVDSIISYACGALAIALPFLLQLAQLAQIIASFVGLAVIIIRFRYDREKLRRLKLDDDDD